MQKFTREYEIYENLSEIQEICRNLRKSTKGYKNLQGSGKGEGAGMEVRERGRAGTGDICTVSKKMDLIVLA